MKLGLVDVEKEAIGNNLSSLMRIVQVQTQMNLVHEELKAACTLELAHDTFTTDAREAFNENKPGAGFDKTESKPTQFGTRFHLDYGFMRSSDPSYDRYPKKKNTKQIVAYRQGHTLSLTI